MEQPKMPISKGMLVLLLMFSFLVDLVQAILDIPPIVVVGAWVNIAIDFFVGLIFGFWYKLLGVKYTKGVIISYLAGFVLDLIPYVDILGWTIDVLLVYTTVAAHHNRLVQGLESSVVAAPVSGLINRKIGGNSKPGTLTGAGRGQSRSLPPQMPPGLLASEGANFEKMNTKWTKEFRGRRAQSGLLPIPTTSERTSADRIKNMYGPKRDALYNDPSASPEVKNEIRDYRREESYKKRELARDEREKQQTNQHGQEATGFVKEYVGVKKENPEQAEKMLQQKKEENRTYLEQRKIRENRRFQVSSGRALQRLEEQNTESNPSPTEPSK